ncbi:hypothetical protein DRQ00_10420 [candidate division KSB1 bacterium]|nr:MAG: hypothetical protein DRQ00_10420 [candidate division KSB1 bacterium]
MAVGKVFMVITVLRKNCMILFIRKIKNKKINKLPQSNFGRIKAKEIKNRILVYNRTKKKPLL